MTGSMRVLTAADAAVAEVPGHAFRVLADAGSTGGRYSLTEATSPVGAGVPPHIHRGAVECFYVLAGDYRLTVSGQVHEAGPGGFLLVPRGAAHEFEVVGSQLARAVVIFSPAGFERCFRAMPEIFGTPGEPGPLWEHANLEQGTVLLAPDQPHPPGPAAVRVAVGQPPADAASLATPAHTHTGLAITRHHLGRGRAWQAGEAAAAWVLDGTVRVETAAGDVTARPGQLVTLDAAAGPARAVALTGAVTLLVLSTSPA
jgi:quercetin dioxygenase-like cupin family protein